MFRLDCVVFSLLFGFSFLNERCVLTLRSTAVACNATFPAKQAGQGCVNLAKVGKLQLFCTEYWDGERPRRRKAATPLVLGNVRTHISLRKLNPNNKEKNYSIYDTVQK